MLNMALDQANCGHFENQQTQNSEKIGAIEKNPCNIGRPTLSRE